MSDKQELRRAIRAAYPGEAERDRQSTALCGYVRQSECYRNAKVICGYMPMKREADILPLMRSALEEGKQLLLPRVEAAGVMTLRRVTSLEQLAPGSYGILEPCAEAPEAEPEEADLVLTPVEAMDRSGLRLGKGGGFYDRLLEGRKLLTLGMVMSWQWTEHIPAEAWDQPLCGAADETGIVWFQGGPENER